MVSLNQRDRVSPDPAGSHRESLGRMLLLKIALILFFAAVGLRLVQIQVLESGTYKEIARRQYEARVVLPATRGNICDREGRILVSNTVYISFGADPKIVADNRDAVAARFARVFDNARSQYLEKLLAPGRRFVWLERRVKPDFAGRINAQELEGVVVLNEPLRVYHYGHVAGQLLGFTDIDNNGLSGVELQMDEHLHGANGFVIMQRDGLGRRRPSVDYPRVEPVNGRTVVLTIDLEYQAIAEDELRRGIERNKAKSGLVIMLDPRTGEVLAMAHWPGVDPAKAGSADPSLSKNRGITDMFEPGSVFKVVTAAAALEANLVRPDQKFNAENGRYVVTLAGGKSRVITDTKEYGSLTFQEGMEHSSNIVMAKVSDIIGAEKLYTTARNFGFGIPTGIELPGEVSGELKKPNRWSGTTLNTLAYGYEVGVTPIQLAAAYAAVANDGVLMRPFVVRQVRDERGEVVAETRPQMIRRVISPVTARTLREFFAGVVERGTGTAARLEDVAVAGKTGTSRKVVEGKYEPGNYTASFAGFFPADDPRVVCVVMLDNPGTGAYTGGLASAPIFRAIAEKVVTTSARFSTKSPVVWTHTLPLAVPDVSGLRIDRAVAALTAQGLKAQPSGSGKVVLQQTPPPGTKVAQGSSVRLATEGSSRQVAEGYALVPDVRGMTIRRARNRLLLQNLEIEVEGSGVVVAQHPAPGQAVKTGTPVAVRCSPRSLSVLAAHP